MLACLHSCNHDDAGPPTVLPEEEHHVKHDALLLLDQQLRRLDYVPVQVILENRSDQLWPEQGTSSQIHNKSEVELQTGFQTERSLRSLFLPALLPVEHPDRPLGDGVVLEDVLAVVLELDVLGAGGHDAGDLPVPALRLVPLHDLSLGLVRTAGPHVPCTQGGECTDLNELSS